MEENIGNVDRIIRFLIALVFIVIGFTVSNWWFIVAALALITAFTGLCWAYKLFGISTYKDKSKSTKKQSPSKKRKK